MFQEKELSASLPTARVVNIECRSINSMGSKERMCAIVEFDKFRSTWAPGGTPKLSNHGKSTQAIALDFFDDEPKGKKKKGWLQKTCKLIWSRLGAGGSLQLKDIKAEWPKIPSLIKHTEWLIEEIRTQKNQSGHKALEDSLRREARQLIEECEKLNLDPCTLVQEEVNLFHVEKVMES